ncbi:hypothetical protein Ciccas_012405, partial [Cichlidogyrus casuarinus]
AIYAWYVASAGQAPADTQCLTFSRAPSDDPLQTNFQAVGWLIASAPVILGLLIGLAVNSVNSRRSSANGVDCCAYMLGGDLAVARAGKNTTEEAYQTGNKYLTGTTSTRELLSKTGSEYLAMNSGPQWKPIQQPPMTETNSMTLQRMQRESEGLYGYGNGDQHTFQRMRSLQEQESTLPRSKDQYRNPMLQSRSYGDLKYYETEPAELPYQRRYSQHSNFLNSSQEDLLEAYTGSPPHSNHQYQNKEHYKSNRRHQKTALLRKL